VAEERKEREEVGEREEEEAAGGVGGGGGFTTPTLLVLSPRCICSSSALCARNVSLDCQGLPMNAVPSSKLDRESVIVRWEEEGGGGVDRKGLL
jgi:hypothetical protein